MGEDLLVGRRLGGFEVDAVLGRGGFATVYRARQVRLGRDVALKVLDPMLARDADAARRFEREGWAAAGLDHPCIVPVFEAGEEGGVVFLAMRLVRGRSLADELVSGPTAPDRTLAVVDAVGSALDHAHGRGLLHRDVKPANILLEDDSVWLSDFGIAAMAQQVGHYTKGAIGTAAYMAPEQARPGEAGPQADLYSLGCVAYECLTGGPPFDGGSFPELLHAHAFDPVPATGQAALDAFFSRALAKAPSNRFESGAELAAELAGAVGRGGDAVTPRMATTRTAPLAPPASHGLDETVSASAAAAPTLPPPSAGAPRRPGRRRLVAVALGVVLVVGAITAAVLASSGGGGGANHAAPTTTRAVPTTMTQAQAGAEYLAAVKPVNDAEPAFADPAHQWTSSTPSSLAVAQSTKLLAAIEAVQPRLDALADAYPAGAADFRADRDAAAAVRRDLLALPHLNSGVGGIAVSTWLQQYDADIAKLIAASNAVRADLGLPTTRT